MLVDFGVLAWIIKALEEGVQVVTRDRAVRVVSILELLKEEGQVMVVLVAAEARQGVRVVVV